mgnify:FL=1
MDFTKVMDRIAALEGARSDQEIANCLGQTKQSFAGYKKRGSVPLQEVIDYCIKNERSVDHVLFGTDLPYVNKDLEKENIELKARLTEVKQLLLQVIRKE